MKKSVKLLLLLNSMFATGTVFISCVNQIDSKNESEEAKNKVNDEYQNSSSSESNSKSNSHHNSVNNNQDDFEKPKNANSIDEIIKKGGTVVDDSPVMPTPEEERPNNQFHIPGKPDNANTLEYKKATTSNQYYYDADAYAKALKNHLESIGINVDLPSDIDTDQYNKRSIALNQPKFADAYYQNFSYFNNKGLVINPIGNSTRTAHWDSTPGNRGRSRILPNSIYKQAALQSYSIIFHNQRANAGADEGELNHLGTGWILDYKLENGEKYPLKWYIATNIHVAEAFVKSQKDSSIYQNYKNSQLDLELKNVTDNRKKWEKAYIDKVEGFAKEAREKELLKLKSSQEYQSKLQSNKQEADEWLKTKADQVYNDVKATPRSDLEEFTEWAKYKRQEDALLKDNKGNTRRITLVHLNDKAKLHTKLSINAQNEYFDSFTFEPEQVKIVYAATDFLKTSPKEYLDPDSPYKEYQEMADFAVLEFDFSNLKEYINYTNNGFPHAIEEVEEREGNRPLTSEDIARIATSNYANEPDKQIKFPTNSLYKDYDKLEKTILDKSKFTKENQEVLGNDPKLRSQLNWNFVALGYPLATSDNQVDRLEAEKYNGILQFNGSLWTNKPRLDSFPDELGNGLTKAVTFRSFADKKGISDILIVNPMANPEKREGFVVKGIKEKEAPYKGDHYLFYGLGYSLSSWEPLGGASGSSIRDINNNLYGINFFAGTANGFSNVSLIAALRSEGIDYQGFYGKYNMEEYDLIYGGGKNQRTSYRQALEKLYGDDYHTNLFKKGVKSIPEGYEFQK